MSPKYALKICEKEKITTYVARQTFSNSTGETGFYADKFKYDAVRIFFYRKGWIAEYVVVVLVLYFSLFTYCLHYVSVPVIE